MGGGRSGRQRRFFLATPVALAAMTLVGCSCGGDVPEAAGTRAGRIESTASADVIAATGGRILREIAEARGDIHRDYLLRAEGKIDCADRMLDGIEQALPTAELRERIWIARRHLDYADSQEVEGDLAPIYAALAEVESLAPADSIRRQLDRAKRNLERGDRKAAGRALTRADQELLFVEVDLPLSSTRRHLAQAREALAVGEPERGAAYLQQAEEGLALLTGVARSPLAAARWSLAKAVAAFQKGDIEGAERYVALARRSVDQSGADASEASPAALSEVAEELRGLEGRLPGDGANDLRKLERSLGRVAALPPSS